MLNQPAAPSLEKVSWNDVIKMGEQVSKQATIGNFFLLLFLSLLFLQFGAVVALVIWF